MNIEEDDLVRPVHEVGDRLGYVHIGENHRGYLGSGHLDFTAFFHALADIGYQGPITFEVLLLGRGGPRAVERPGRLAEPVVRRRGPGPPRPRLHHQPPPRHPGHPVTLEDLLARARHLGASRTTPVVIGVVGAPGAGKTTLVETSSGN